MFDYIMSFEWNGWIGITLYWVPFGFCVFGYTLRTINNYLNDKARRELKGNYYVPTDRVGSLIGRALVSVIPVANLWAAMFDLAPKIFGRLLDVVEAVFSQPLVPDTESAKAQRHSKD